VHEIAMDASFAKLSATNGVDAQDIMRKAPEEHPPTRMTLTGDGRFITETSVFEHATQIDESAWSVASEVGERVTIEIHHPGKPIESMTYTFVEPDLIRSEDRLTGGMLLRRVK